MAWVPFLAPQRRLRSPPPAARPRRFAQNRCPCRPWSTLRRIVCGTPQTCIPKGQIPAQATLTPIHAIQGNGHISPLVGQVVHTTGVVTAVDTNGSRGFYIQDPTGDGNTATSDGIFVFRPSGALSAIGHLVRVSGTVQICW